MKTLLEKALETRSIRGSPKGITDEHIDLVLAWLDGTIHRNAVSVVVGMSGGATTYGFILHALRVAYHRGRLTIVKK